MILAVINLVVLNGIIKVFRRMRKGDFDEAELEDHLNKRGFMNRILGGATKAVRKSWHMYPVGLLFGLGFDTATEISLLVLAGGAAAFQLPWYAILTLPILFAAGMSLLDTIDGSFMNFAYDWAFSKPVRKVYYNITITALSVAVALIIGAIELTSILADKTGIESGPIRAIADLNLNFVGYAIVALFVITWAVAIVLWKVLRVEEKWSVNLKPAAQATSTHRVDELV
jgi:high-affinity nickel-transport protein